MQLQLHARLRQTPTAGPLLQLSARGVVDDEQARAQAERDRDRSAFQTTALATSRCAGTMPRAGRSKTVLCRRILSITNILCCSCSGTCIAFARRGLSTLRRYRCSSRAGFNLLASPRWSLMMHVNSAAPTLSILPLVRRVPPSPSWVS